MESILIIAGRVLVGTHGYLCRRGHDFLLRTVPKGRSALRCADDSGWWRGHDGNRRTRILQRRRLFAALARNRAGAHRIVFAPLACWQVTMPLSASHSGISVGGG